MNNRSKGTLYEEKTCVYIQEQGMELVTKNYSCKCGELDIIAKDQDSLVFIEVKYRSSMAYGHPSYAIDYRKQRKITQSAVWYTKEVRWIDRPVRFDVALWTGNQLEYHKGAFNYHG
jgi:putative endonuclease